MPPRIFISVPEDRHLDGCRQRFKRPVLWAIVAQRLDVVGSEPEQFGTGVPKPLNAWTVDRAQGLLLQRDGLLALARRHVQLPGAAPQPGGRPALLPVPTTNNHLEGAIGLALGLPLLVKEQGMAHDGIFTNSVRPAEIPAAATETWADRGGVVDLSADHRRLLQATKRSPLQFMAHSLAEAT